MDKSHKDKTSLAIQQVTVWGMAINISLTALKLLVGWLCGSLALAADGFHSLSDLATDVTVLLGVKWADKAPDASHPYGHGRIETFAAGLVAAALAVVGGWMIYQAAIGIADVAHEPKMSRLASAAVLTVAAVSVVVKEWLYRWTHRVAMRTHSAALDANAWHHRSDAFSSIAVLVGAGAYALGYPYGDHLAAIGVGLMIILVAAQILGDCINEFSERAVDEATLSQIRLVIQSDDRIRHWHRLRTRRVGREIFIDLHILVDPALSIEAAHRISDQLEQQLQDSIRRPLNVLVHLEPDLPEMRR